MALSPEERDELRVTARSLLERETSPWDLMVELGWTSIHIEERHGGADCGQTDLAVVVREMGRAVVSSPFLASAVLATGALALADHEDLAAPLLSSLAEGQSIGSVAFASAAGSYGLARSSTAWQSSGGSVRLDGVAGYVLDADLADVLVVAAADDAGTVAAVVIDGSTPGMRAEQVATVDETRRLFTVTFDGVTVPADRMLCEPGARAEQLFDRVLALGVVAAAGDAVGAAERAMEVAAEHARERVQFGKPIGSFQAVKHHCANMAIAVEASRAAAEAAAAELDGDPGTWRTTAGITASYVGPACSEVCALAVRVHGGIGFTWEHDAHVRLKRVKLDEVLFGTPSWHRRRLADDVFPTLVAS
jgi:alkylation response protein AidB-like acyl-CoA dehydrogenase